MFPKTKNKWKWRWGESKLIKIKEVCTAYWCLKRFFSSGIMKQESGTESFDRQGWKIIVIKCLNVSKTA